MLMLFFTQKLNFAVENLERAIEINQAVKLFKNDELAGAYYILAMAYGQMGRINKAKNAANASLQLKPNFPEANAVLEKLKDKKN